MDEAAKRFGRLLSQEKLRHQIRHDSDSLLCTLHGPSGSDVSIEFRDDGIYGTIEAKEFIHYWEIHPEDFRQAVKKIREIA